MSQFVEEQSRRRWAAGRWSTVRQWTGPTEDLPEFLSLELPPNYAEFEEIKTEDGLWTTIQAVYAFDPENPPEEEDDGLVSRKWTLDANEEDRPLSEHPKVQALMDVAPDWPLKIEAHVRVHLKQMQTAIDDPTQDLPEWTWPEPPAALAASGLSDTEQEILVDWANQYASILLGQPQPIWGVDAPILRKVEVVASYGQIKANHEDLGKVYSYAQLCAAEPTLPEAALINAADLSDYFWLKKRPTVDELSGGLYQINLEYWGAKKFSSFIYDPK